MKKSFRLLAILPVLCVCTLVMTSCSEKVQAIHDLEQLAKDVQENGNNYGFSEWKDVFQQYQSITAVTDKYSNEYSQKQRTRIMHAKATIKQAAWDKLNDSLDVFGLKQPLMDWYNSLFGDVSGDGTGTTEE